MKIRVEHTDTSENEVVLRCRELDEEMLEVLSLLKERMSKIPAYQEGETFMISPNNILYAESVDGATFLYTKEEMFRAGMSLAQLELSHADTGLLRISKSQLVNLHKVEHLKSLPNSRIQITLMNKERLIVSRHYIQNLKIKLGIE